MADSSLEVLDFLREHRISTAEASDAMGKVGHYPYAIPLNHDHYRIGKIHYTFAYELSNWQIHKDIATAEEGNIVLIDDLGNEGRGLFGELVTRFLFEERNVGAVITNGPIRDVQAIQKRNFPVWSNGTNPMGCFNACPEHPPPAMARKRKHMLEGGIAICDVDGVVLITKAYMEKGLLEALQTIRKREISWEQSIFREKKTTFDTICLKK